jgi:transposase InsO family protein
MYMLICGGASRKVSHGGARYMRTIIDDYSHRVWPYFLRNKSDAFESFKTWKVMLEKQPERKLKVLRTDNGMKFCSSDFKSFYRKACIVGHHIVPHTPHQNGVAECMNKTIISKAHCMLSNSGLSRKFLAEAASIACHLINCSPSTAISKKTPIEVWSSSLFDYSELRVFGCTAYAHVDKSLEQLSAFLGVMVPVLKLINYGILKHTQHFYSRNVVFNESTMFTSYLSTNDTNQNSESIRV